MAVPMRPNPIGDAIAAELARLGWVEGKTVTYDVRDPPSDLSKLRVIAAELANRRAQGPIGAGRCRHMPANMSRRPKSGSGHTDEIQQSSTCRLLGVARKEPTCGQNYANDALGHCALSARGLIPVRF
jgi:hypothetical protein